MLRDALLALRPDLDTEVAERSVAAFSSVLQCCSSLQCVAVCCSPISTVMWPKSWVLHVWCSLLHACCNLLQQLQRGAVWCSVLQRVAVCCSALRCVAARCGVLQRVAVCCNVFYNALVLLLDLDSEFAEKV